MSNTKKLPRRKGEKKVTLVEFEVEGFEGTFEVPAMNSLDMGVQRRLQNNEISPMIEALGEDAGVVDDMTDGEFAAFMDAWAKASGVDLGKSAPAAS